MWCLLQYLVGKYIGLICVGLYVGCVSGIIYVDVEVGCMLWFVIDDVILDYLLVSWCKWYFFKVMFMYFVNSLQIVVEMVGMGMGVGILFVVMVQECSDLVVLCDL